MELRSIPRIWYIFLLILGKLYNEDPDQLQDPFDYENFDLIDEYWTYYEGNFVADEKDGEGKMVFSNG